MADGPGSLDEQAGAFAERTERLMTSALPDAPAVEAVIEGKKVVVRPIGGKVPLFVAGTQLAHLIVSYACRLDHRGAWLAIEESTFELRAELDRTPVLRFDYNRDSKKSPSAHLNVHAHRGALSHLLSQAGHAKAHDMSALHIPLGGARFRPCLEDVVEFLVCECKFDKRQAWRKAVKEGRATWRRTQALAVVRDFPEEAAQGLRQAGFRVSAPKPAPTAGDKALHRWCQRRSKIDPLAPVEN